MSAVHKPRPSVPESVIDRIIIRDWLKNGGLTEEAERLCDDWNLTRPERNSRMGFVSGLRARLLAELKDRDAA